MGSKGSKPRKPKHSQHLPKAGTAPSNQRLQHEEQQAVFDTVGLGGASPVVKYVVIAVVAVLFVGAIFSLLLITL
ncbi:MAG: hypothetical protein SGJ13_15685 [Actinomycetota bacterium]|nr:hypothetical protein [Actinomycetota bacterium]